ncbi:MAG: Smr/MutS family protein [Candidatus Adiutrix sp.]|jgi:DNA-nicking Smr family endonuclease|nr:Smr/MutS family protein [Candidatus Adiutrix sp.]
MKKKGGRQGAPAQSSPVPPAFNPAFVGLADLKKNLKPSAAEPGPPAPVKPAPPPPTAGDEALFRAEMADVVPLYSKAASRRLKEAPSPRAWPTPQMPDEDIEALRSLADLVSGRAEFDLTHTAEFVEGQTRGLPSTLMEQLRAGRIPFQDHLDLHGLTLTQSEAAVTRFILDSVAKGRRSVLLIHGRGLGSPDGVPVIKHNLENLLLHGPAAKYILAFTTARPVDGGLGASYVLLRG